MFILNLLLLGAVLVTGAAGRSCSESLGMENGRISDVQLSASSSYEINSVGPAQARLNNNNGGGAWCPKSFISQAAGSDEFLEIDLGEEHTVTGVITQGRFANGQGQEFAEHFLVEYWKPGMEDFAEYKDGAGVDLFPGNRDTYTEVETELNPPVVASRVRIVPFSYHPRTVCMRVELKGCKATETGKSFRNLLQGFLAGWILSSFHPVRARRIVELSPLLLPKTLLSFHTFSRKALRIKGLPR